MAVAVGPAFEPFAPPVFKKCLDIIETTLIVMLSGHDGMGGGVNDPISIRGRWLCAVKSGVLARDFAKPLSQTGQTGGWILLGPMYC